MSGDILILTKEDSGPSSLFRAPANTAPDTSVSLELLTSVDVGADQATAGDASPTGDRFLVRTYTSILLWPRGESLAATFAASASVLPSPTEPQGESLTFSADGAAWLASGEREMAIYQGLSTRP